MAWTAPRTWVASELVTASIMNAHVRDNLSDLRTGGVAIASQAALDFVYASSATQLARLAKGTAYQVPRMNAAADAYEFADVIRPAASQAALDFLYGASATTIGRVAKGTALQTPRMNAAADGWEFASFPLTLLKSNSGTNTNASAASMDTLALASGLGANDRLIITAYIYSKTQKTTDVVLYNATDGFALITALTGDVVVDDYYSFVWIVQSEPDDKKVITTQLKASGGGGGDASALSSGMATFTTAWTGAWTLALRHGGVTSGGTCYWRWCVHRLAG